MPTGARSETQIETDFFRVTKWTVDPGGTIPMHQHEREYVVIPMSSGVMTVKTPDGRVSTSRLTASESYTRPSGSTHQIENGEQNTMEFIEVERLS